MRFSLLSNCRLTSAIVLASCFLSGCGKIPTWSELTGGKKPPAATPTQPVPAAQPVPQPVPQPVAVPVPAKPSNEDVIANFKKTPPGMIDNAALAALTSLDEEGRVLITEINASGGKVTDEGLSQLNKLPSLRALELNGTAVSDAGCAAIAQVPTLEVLTLTGSRITDVGIAHLVNLPQLKTLKIEGVRLSTGGWEVIGRFPALEELVVTQSNIDDKGLEGVCECSTLHALVLQRTMVRDQGLLALRKLDRLTELNLADCPNFRGDTLGGAMKGKSPTVLSLWRTPLNDRGARAVGKLGSVEDLVIGELTGMTDVQFGIMVKGKKKLRRLSAANNPLLTNNSLVALKELTDLEFVNVSNCPQLNDRGLVFLKRLQKLKQFRFGGTGITLAGVRMLAVDIPALRDELQSRSVE